jgi:uncharacterized protein YbcI
MPDASPRRGELLTSISNALVRLHKEYYGKGPTKTKTFIVDDTVVCILRGGFTAVERTLVASGRDDAVREIRHAFQQAMAGPFTAVVEETLGRKVIAYLSQVHPDPEVSVEVFLLQPGVPEEGAVFEHEERHDTDLREEPE